MKSKVDDLLRQIMSLDENSTFNEEEKRYGFSHH